MFAYSNNGFSMRSIEPGMVEPGEALIDHYPATEDELLAAFPGRGAMLADEAKAQARAILTNSLQALLDTTSRERGYDGILSLCSYASSANPRFGAEGRAGVAWRDAVWAAGYQVVADIEAGRRAIPTPEELVAEMPVMVWPA